MSCQRTAVVSAAFALVLSFASSAFAAAFAPVISDDFTYADQSWSTNGTSGDTGLGGGIGFSQNWQYQLGPNGLSSAAISSGELVLSTNSTGGAAAIFERDFASAISPGATTTRLSFSQQSNAGLAFAALRLRTGTTDRLRIGLQNNSGNPSAYSAWYAGTSVNISSFSTATRNWTVDFVWN
ncbi:MAG: hypothetical protein MI757_03755 [Pirellulales bacterium]|nr:hypothetical protein [Pirellulales bacterium]